MTTSPTLLTEQDVARMLGCSPRSLQKARVTGTWDLTYSKIGTLVRYDERDVLAFIARGRRRSTSDPGRAAA
jgi:hypothetical protein